MIDWENLTVENLPSTEGVLLEFVKEGHRREELERERLNTLAHTPQDVLNVLLAKQQTKERNLNGIRPDPIPPSP